LATFVHHEVVVDGEPVDLTGYAAGLQDVVEGFDDYNCSKS
jgi:hypothetical protein